MELSVIYNCTYMVDILQALLHMQWFTNPYKLIKVEY